MLIVQKANAEQDGSTVVLLCAEEAARDVLGYWFTSLPVRTVVAADGYEANRQLEDPTCRLFVTDRVLPPWPGLDTFMQLRAANPHLRIAFVDGGAPDARILARLTGATVILPKPLIRQTAIDALQRRELVA